MDKNNIINRLKEEFKIVKEEPFPSLGISVGLAENNNYFKWIVTIFGPDDSIYAEGIFKLSIEFNEDYPLIKPLVKFKTKIYHCNVSDEGDLNIPSLNKWNPNITMSQVLSDIFSLFYLQIPDKDFNPDKSKEILDRNKFEDIAREHVKKFALI